MADSFPFAQDHLCFPSIRQRPLAEWRGFNCIGGFILDEEKRIAFEQWKETCTVQHDSTENSFVLA